MPLYVNNIEITDEQVFAEMQYHPASSVSEAQEKAARALAIRELLLQEAARAEIAAPSDEASEEVREDYVISRLLEQEIGVPEPSELTCRNYYEQNKETFRDREGNPVLFEYVQTTIAAYLKEVSEQAAIKQYLSMLIEKANIAGVSLKNIQSE